MKSSAVISECGLYRYSLTREWDASLPRAAWCMLNPSTADALIDDPTIRRVIGLSKSWGFGSVEVVNLFAFRATDPKAMRASWQPIGPMNDTFIKTAADVCGAFIAAWGASGTHRSRAWEVLRLIEGIPVWCCGMTKGGQPKHPLYVHSMTKRVLLNPSPEVKP